MEPNFPSDSKRDFYSFLPLIDGPPKYVPSTTVRGRELNKELVNCLYNDDNRDLQSHSATTLANLAGHEPEICPEIGDFPGALAGLVKVLAKDSGNGPDAQKESARALANLARHDNRDLRWKIINCPGALEELVNGLYTDENRDLQKNCARAVGNLGCGDLEICGKIGNFPRALAGLVGVLAKDSGNGPDAQAESAKALANLAGHNHRDLPWKIINTPGALEKLVNGLYSDENQGLQQNCARAVRNLACGDLELCGKIGDFPRALPGLVRLLNRSNRFQQESIRALANLAGHGNRDLQWKIVNAPRALEKLVSGWDLYSFDMKGECARAFANLTCGDPEICGKIGNFPGALTLLVRELTKKGRNSPDVQVDSARALANLGGHDDRDLQWKIINHPTALEVLVNGLYNDDNRNLQSECARALANLVGHDDRDLQRKIINTPRALEVLVNGLYNDDNRDLQSECARAFARLACDDLEICGEVRNFPGALAGLVRVFNGSNSGSTPDAQNFCARALAILGPEGSLGWDLGEEISDLGEEISHVRGGFEGANGLAGKDTLNVNAPEAKASSLIDAVEGLGAPQESRVPREVPFPCEEVSQGLARVQKVKYEDGGKSDLLKSKRVEDVVEGLILRGKSEDGAFDGANEDRRKVASSCDENAMRQPIADRSLASLLQMLQRLPKVSPFKKEEQGSSQTANLTGGIMGVESHGLEGDATALSPCFALGYGDESRIVTVGMVEDVVKELRNGPEDGFFISTEWWYSCLGAHHKEILTTLFSKAGYSNFYQGDTSCCFERFEEQAQIAASSTVDATPLTESAFESRSQDSKPIAALKRFLDLLGIQTIKSDWVGDQQTTDAKESEKIAHEVANSEITKGKPPILLKAEMEQTLPADKALNLESFILLLKDISLHGCFVSTKWLSSLSSQDDKLLTSFCSQAGYSKVYSSTTVTRFERIWSHEEPTSICSHGSTTATETCVTGGIRNSGCPGVSTTTTQEVLEFPPNGLDMRNPDLKPRLANAAQASQNRIDICYCPPQKLKVKCLPSSYSALSPSPSTGADESKFTRCLVFGDTQVSLPKKEGDMPATAIIRKDIPLSMKRYNGTRNLETAVISMTATVESTVSCCLKSHEYSEQAQNKVEKARIKIITIRCLLENKSSNEKRPNVLVLKCGRINLAACIAHCNSGESEGDGQQITLDIEKDYREVSSWRRVVEPCLESQEGGLNDRVWLALSGEKPEYSEVGSTTVELRCNVPKTAAAAEKELISGAPVLLFHDLNHPVVLEGIVSTVWRPTAILEFDIRYQVEVSYMEPCTGALSSDVPIVGVKRKEEIIEFDRRLEFKTLSNSLPTH